MICILSPHTDPYFNTAAEEFIFKNFSEDCLLLWQNSPSIIIGKHQNALAEINCDFIEKNNIPVVRRTSGGGAVFHDLGNVNFSFITTSKTEKAIQFKTFLLPIVNFLQSLGITVQINSRNNLFIDEKKISGTAAHIFKNKTIHHGTLLFNTSEPWLLKSLENHAEKYSDKGVKSVPSQTTNIADHLTCKMEVSDFIKELKKELISYFQITDDYSFSEKEQMEIKALSEKKYRSWEWNYGYSPAYVFKNSISIHNNLFTILLIVNKGIIEKCEIKNNDKNQPHIEISITGLHHEKKAISSALKRISMEFLMKDLF